jgi:hypothetical protein
LATRQPSPRIQRFLDVLDQEHAITRRVLEAYPADRLDLRPHPRARSAGELGWVFVLERGLGEMVYRNEFPEKASGVIPEPPGSWQETLDALAGAHASWRTLVASTSDADMERTVRFLTAPKTVGEYTVEQWLWFLLHDEIHHRGQFSVYLRMADARVPSIYGPTADEEWF